MKQKPGYLLQHIGDSCYILPYGQHIADHKRGISISGAGEYLWELLENEISREELYSECFKRFMPEPDEEEGLIKEINKFLGYMTATGFVEDGPAPPRHTGRPYTCLGIGGLVIAYYGPTALVDASFIKEFCIGQRESFDQRVVVEWGPVDSAVGGNILVRNSELIVSERGEDYLLIFPGFSRIREVQLSKDAGSAVFRCLPPCDDKLETEFFHALRHVFLYLAKMRRMYAVHSASICYEGKAWLFSASSGTGKSTHTNLWRELYDVELLNGDLNLIAMEDGRPVVHGIPWCGTSEIYTKKTVPLGGIVLLKRSEEDKVEELPQDKQALLVTQRFISPMWTAEQLKSGVGFSEELTGKILVCRLHCTKSSSAAEAAKDRIDRYLG